MEKDNQEHDMCPIFCMPFKYKEVVVDYEKWKDKKLKAHLA